MIRINHLDTLYMFLGNFDSLSALMPLLIFALIKIRTAFLPLCQQSFADLLDFLVEI